MEFTAEAPWYSGRYIGLAVRETWFLISIYPLSNCVIQNNIIHWFVTLYFHLGNGCHNSPYHRNVEDKSDSTDKAPVTVPGTEPALRVPSPSKQVQVMCSISWLLYFFHTHQPSVVLNAFPNTVVKSRKDNDFPPLLEGNSQGILLPV